MADTSKLVFDGQPTEKELKKTEAANAADQTARIAEQPQSNPGHAFLQVDEPSATEIRLAKIERKLNAIMDHLGISR